MSETMYMSEFRSLFGKNEFRSTTSGYYEWKLLKNPYKHGKLYLEYKDDIIVGSTTITPKKVSILGKELLAAEIGDTFTHPKYRRQGIFSRGVNACTNYSISNGIEVIYGTPNSESLPGYQKKLNYFPCPYLKLNYLTKHWRAQAVSLIKMMLRKRTENLFFFLSAMLKQKYSHFRFSHCIDKASDVSIEILSKKEFTEEIDGLWGSPRYIFLTIRDKVYLNWRFFTNPDEYKVITAKKGDEYLGYIVVKLSKNGKIGTICDFITKNDRMDVFNALILEAEHVLENARVHLIQLRCGAGSPYHQTIINHGYYDHGALGRQPVIVFAGTEYGKKILEENAKWHFTFSDSDNI